VENLTEQTLKALLEQAGLEPREGDLESFAKLIERYRESLKTLHSVDLGDEEIAPTFHPGRSTKP
jgi:hypothetical protein